MSEPQSLNKYTYCFHAKCPNNGIRISYCLVIETTEVLMVEAIMQDVADCTIDPVFHEALADKFHGFWGGVQTMTAHHHGVDIETRRG